VEPKKSDATGAGPSRKKKLVRKGEVLQNAQRERVEYRKKQKKVLYST